ncbi:MAG: hypothetical protein AVW06_02715 [Hadesarchaea archaeon DG-33-1]|nr:MAG: hypothetical protein AVW06_02715 [Hadesarchaea archaeon DG-33-1]
MVKIDIDPSIASPLLSPKLAVLVTTNDAQSKPNIITLAWAMPTSRNPPLVAISVGTRRYSHRLIESCEEFVVNVPSQRILEQVHYCGRKSGRVINKFAETKLTKLKSQKVEPPRIKECVAHIECKLVGKLRTGDHTIFIGEVVAASVDEETFDRERGVVNLGQFKPVLHLGGDFYSTAEKTKRVALKLGGDGKSPKS